MKIFDEKYLDAYCFDQGEISGMILKLDKYISREEKIKKELIKRAYKGDNKGLIEKYHCKIIQGADFNLLPFDPP